MKKNRTGKEGFEPTFLALETNALPLNYFPLILYILCFIFKKFSFAVNI